MKRAKRSRIVPSRARKGGGSAISGRRPSKPARMVRRRKASRGPATHRASHSAKPRSPASLPSRSVRSAPPPVTRRRSASPKPPASKAGRSARRAKPSFYVDSSGRIRLPSGRFAPREVVERAALRGGFSFVEPSGKTVRVRPVKAQRKGERSIAATRGRQTIKLEEGTAKRVRKDRAAVELGAVRFQRREGAAGARVNSYVLPRPLPLDAAAQALRNVVDSAAGGELDKFAKGHVIAKLVDEDGKIIYRAVSHAKIGSGAVNEAASTLAGWARRYKRSRLIGIDVLKLGRKEQREDERRTKVKAEGRRIRAREARDRRRGTRTTRGR